METNCDWAVPAAHIVRMHCQVHVCLQCKTDKGQNTTVAHSAALQCKIEKSLNTTATSAPPFSAFKKRIKIPLPHPRHPSVLLRKASKTTAKPSVLSRKKAKCNCHIHGVLQCNIGKSLNVTAKPSVLFRKEAKCHCQTLVAFQCIDVK